MMIVLMNVLITGISTNLNFFDNGTVCFCVPRLTVGLGNDAASDFDAGGEYFDFGYYGNENKMNLKSKFIIIYVIHHFFTAY